MKKIPLTQGKFALVDDDDFEYLNQWKWHSQNGYAVRELYIGGGRKNKKVINIFMHRVVNRTLEHLNTDHIDGNRLNNRKENLRSCTASQNLYNRGAAKGSASKFKGVVRSKTAKKWVAQARLNGKMHYIGTYKTEKAAAQAYNMYTAKVHGEFALVNKS